jgi:thiamine pyrophosphate-dependent acetolactate synthase large subunit-like protein
MAEDDGMAQVEMMLAPIIAKLKGDFEADLATSFEKTGAKREEVSKKEIEAAVANFLEKNDDMILNFEVDEFLKWASITSDKVEKKTALGSIKKYFQSRVDEVKDSLKSV